MSSKNLDQDLAALPPAELMPLSAARNGLADELTDDLPFEDFYPAPRFGGSWTLIKLEALRKYLAAYTNALKHQPFRLLYIDAFAGTGKCDVGDSDVHNGSATIALNAWPPFSEHIFIERSAARCAELQRLVDECRYRAAIEGDTEKAQTAVRIIKGDANEQLRRLCAETNWRSTRAVLFLDPFGMSVAWATLEQVAATKAIDLWYLFPINAVYRQLALDLSAVDLDKRASLTKTLGTEDWQRDFYEPPRVGDLFDHPGAPKRHADWQSIAAWITRRLRTIFVRVPDPKFLYLTRAGYASQGAPLFALHFAVSNPSAAAAELACRIASHILSSDLTTVS